MQALATSDYRGYGWADNVDEEDSYPLYASLSHFDTFIILTLVTL